MARVFNGSNQYLSASSTLLGDEPLSLLVGAKPSGLTGTQCVLGLGNNGSNGNFFQGFVGTGPAGPVALKNNDAGTGNATATAGASLADGAWGQIAAVFRDNASRDSYLDGADKGSNTTSRTDPTPDFISVGALRRSSVGSYFAGAVAEVYVLRSAPTDAQVACLGKGINAIDVVGIGSIAAWYPLLRDGDSNRVAGGYPDLTATNSPTTEAHPAQVIYPQVGGLIGL